MLFGAMIQNFKLIALIAIVATALIYRAVLVHQRDSARAQVTALGDAAVALRWRCGRRTRRWRRRWHGRTRRSARCRTR